MPHATVEGATIHYETAGDGSPLVLLHGIGSRSRSWRYQISGLADRFQVIAWDAPGYGLSSDPPSPPVEPSIEFYADCLRGLLDVLGTRKIFLLGHSMGGAIAQAFYRRHADYVQALILADTLCVGNPQALDQRLRSIRTMTPSQMAAARAPKLLSRNAPQAVIRQVVSIMSEVRPAGYEFAAVALSKSDTRDVIRKLRVPTLLIWGGEDEITPVWGEVPPGAELQVIPNAGHLCYMEQPELFNEIVRTFLPIPPLRGSLRT